MLVEGYKREAFPKIEIRRDGAASREPLVGTFPQVVAIASDRPDSEDTTLPVFDLNDIKSHRRLRGRHNWAETDMTAKLIDDCFVLDKDRLPHDEAIAILKSRVRPVVGIEQAKLAEAAGRFLAEDVVAPRAIPAHDNAAVDGYAFAHAAYDQANGAKFKVTGQAAAGHPFDGRGRAGERGAHLHRRGDACRLRHGGNAGRRTSGADRR